MSELWRYSAATLAKLIRQREISAREVTESALNRLTEVNPQINAVVAEMPDAALAAATAVDQTLASGDDPGPLAGVPITIKVNTDQAGYATTNGLQLQRDLIAEQDNPVVTSLRQAGAVIIGRTNTPAFSLRWFTRNDLHGHTRNPRNPKLTPGGSSGGAAAAVTAGIGAIAHGTDIAGSIRYPAYACGVHGLRPTLGRVPAINFSAPDRHIGAQIMAVSGPIARSIDDVQLGFHAMAAADLSDPWWVPVPLELPLGAKRAALTVTPEALTVAPEVQAALRDAAQRLEDDGWTVEEVPCPPLREVAQLQAQLWLAEFRRSAGGALAKEDNADANFVYAEMEKRCPAPDLNTLLDTLQARAGLVRQWQQFLDRYPVLLCPVSAELPFPDLADIASPEAFAAIMEAQLLQIGLPFMGLPGLTVSTGMVDNTPVGVQLVAGRYQEARLLRAGAVIERGGSPPSPIDPVVDEC